MLSYNILKHIVWLWIYFFVEKHLEYNFMIYIAAHISLNRMTDVLNIDLLYL